MVNWWKSESNFYGMTTSSKENIETVEFESGKPRDFLKDSTPRRIHSVSFKIATRSEEIFFWNWYENTLLSRSQTVKLVNLLTGEGFKEYRMTAEPQTNDSQYPKEFTTSFEEE